MGNWAQKSVIVHNRDHLYQKSEFIILCLKKRWIPNWAHSTLLSNFWHETNAKYWHSTTNFHKYEYTLPVVWAYLSFSGVLGGVLIRSMSSQFRPDSAVVDPLKITKRVCIDWVLKTGDGTVCYDETRSWFLWCSNGIPLKRDTKKRNVKLNLNYENYLVLA